MVYQYVCNYIFSSNNVYNSFNLNSLALAKIKLSGIRYLKYCDSDSDTVTMTKRCFCVFGSFGSYSKQRAASRPSDIAEQSFHLCIYCFGREICLLSQIVTAMSKIMRTTYLYSA